MTKLSWYGMTLLFGIKNTGKYSNLGGIMSKIIPQHLTDAENIQRAKSAAFSTNGEYTNQEQEVANELLKYWEEKGCPGSESVKPVS